MPTSGSIIIDGANMNDVPPYERPVNMMFQSYALFPHMNVETNVAYGLKLGWADPKLDSLAPQAIPPRRAESACAMDRQYAIHLPNNGAPQLKIAHLLLRPVGRPMPTSKAASARDTLWDNQRRYRGISKQVPE